MSIEYLPSKILKKVAPDSKIERALSSRLSLKKTALVNANLFDFIDTKAIARVALKTIKGYKQRIKDAEFERIARRPKRGVAESLNQIKAEAKSNAEELKAEILDDPAQLIQRVQNEVVFQVKEEIKDRYSGEFYVWLPSDADEPDPEHQLLYGEKFQVGVGEMPGDRPALD